MFNIEYSLTLRKKMSRTPVLYIVFQLQPSNTGGNAGVERQGLNKRVYARYAPVIVPSVTLFKVGAYCLLSQQSSIKVFECQQMLWNERQIAEMGDTSTPQERQAYFEE